MEFLILDLKGSTHPIGEKSMGSAKQKKVSKQPSKNTPGMSSLEE